MVLAAIFYISGVVTTNKPIDGHPVESEIVHGEVFLEPTMFDTRYLRPGGNDGGVPFLPLSIYITPPTHTPTTHSGRTDERNLIPGLQGSGV